MLLGACGGGDGLLLPSEGEPSSIDVIRGNEQSWRVGEPLPKPVVVQVTDSRNRPIEGARVTFVLTTAGPGTGISPDTATTDANGEASAEIMLGTTIGPQIGEARVVTDGGGLPPRVSFSAIAVSEHANSMAAVGGEEQTGQVGAPLGQRLVVQVTDGFGNPIANVPIQWEAEGGGTVSEATVNTDEKGKASVERRLGPTAGTQTTVARSDGLAGSPVTFVHAALAGNASRLSLVSGDDQTGQVGLQLPAELVVRLIDGEGNGVPNTAVAWVVATGGGSVTPSNANTDQDGRASARWTMGGSPGANRLAAVVSGVGVVSFDAIATTGSPAALAIITQPSASARNGVQLGRQPVIQLRDPGGNPVTRAGIPVSVAIGSGSGNLTGTRQRLTDGGGRATFSDLAIVGGGRHTLVFSSGGFASATSDDINVGSIATTTTITADSPDPSAPGTPFNIQFRVTSGGPTPTGSVTVTLADGGMNCTVTLSGGAGSCQFTLTQTGDRTLRAEYSGGPGFEPSSDTETHTVGAPAPGGTVTTITDDGPDPSVSGTTFTVRFAVTANGTTPTGNVRITVSGGTPTCTGALSGGVGSCELTLNTVGDRTLTATYQGGPGLSGSSDTEPHRVNARPAENDEPFADFNWHCDDLTCHFTDASRDDGTITSRHWDFGDGTSLENELNPSHTYSAPGHYHVTLRVTDNGGLSDESDDNVDPEAPPPPNQSPTADFTFRCTDLRCEFEDQSNDTDGRIEDRSWTFGDGGTSDRKDPEHDYPGPNTYSVTLTVTDDDGATGTSTQQVTVNAPPPPPNENPDADFEVECSDLTCTFADKSKDDDGDVVEWTWNFGDGATFSGQNPPPHTYAGEGQFPVTLTVKDNRGGSDTRSRDADPRLPQNQAPSATNDAYTVPQDQPLSVPAPGVLGNDSDPEGSSLSAVLGTGPTNGTVALSQDGSFNYTPNGGYTGGDQFTYSVNDGSQNSNGATVVITVTPP
jgi:PKD repeat protein